jgi:uncharacterized protein YndB with AHSA1/START domain
MTARQDDEPPSLVVRRTIPAARERVFDAWLDPKRVAVFMRPGTVGRTTAEIDARVGGRFRIVMYHAEAGPSGVEHVGEYLLIDRPARLSFTWQSVHTDDRPTLVEIEFIERGSSTEVVLTHRRLPSDEVEGHREGWTDILRALAQRF